MLVLTRKIGQEIYIGDDVVLKVTGVQGGRVKIGIEAPRERRITRPEIENEKKEREETAPRTRGGAALASALH